MNQTDKSIYSDLEILECESACMIDESDADFSSANGSNLKIWDQPAARKIALLKFKLDALSGRKIRRAYLRLVNHEGHDWNATASMEVRQVYTAWTPCATWNTFDGDQSWSAPDLIKDRDHEVKRHVVFRVPEWQPTWFIDVSSIVSNWVETGQDNHGFCLFGGIENEPLNIKCNTPYRGLNPLLVVICSDHITGNGVLMPEQKIRAAYEALSQIYIARDISWSGSFVKNAQANADRLGWGKEYLTALKAYFDFCLTDDGKFKNISEEYFYVSSCGQALVHLYQSTRLKKYRDALSTLRDGLHQLARSRDGIIMAGNRVEVELIFCVCPFLAFYHDQFDDPSSCSLAIEQTITIFDLMIANQTDGIPLQNMDRPLSKGWSRGLGWVMAGMGKLLSSPGIKSCRQYEALSSRFSNLSRILSGYQLPNGLWRSIVQDREKPEEVTGSALIAMGFEYGYQQGILDESYRVKVDRTLNGILKYTKTGIDMGNSFPMNFHEKYFVTDFSGISDQGYGTWMELMTVVAAR